MSKARELSQRAGVDGALSNRNLIINGSHIVNQRGITSVTTGVGSSTFTSDRWISYGNGQAVNITIQEVTLPDGTVVNSHKTTATSALSTVFLHPFQKVETFGKSYLRGKTVTISTWVRTNMSGQRIRICDTTACYTLGDEIPSDGAWHYVTATHTMPSGMATGASDFIQIHPAFGITNTVSGSYIEFTMTQFEVGDTATPFEHRSIGQELALCQRYFYKRYGVNSMLGDQPGIVYNANTFYRIGMTFPVTMRAAPTATTAALFVWDGNNVVGISSLSVTSSLPDKVEWDGTPTTAILATGRPANLYASGGGGYAAFDAEL